MHSTDLSPGNGYRRLWPISTSLITNPSRDILAKRDVHYPSFMFIRGLSLCARAVVRTPLSPHRSPSYSYRTMSSQIPKTMKAIRASPHSRS